MAKPKQTFTTAEDPAPEPSPPFKAAEPQVEAPWEGEPAAVLPKDFQPMDSAPQDGTTLRMWFGTGPQEMGPEYFALARWRRSRCWSAKEHRFVETGFWVRPATNLKIDAVFTAWMKAGPVTQEDIDASNFAVHQENARREKALLAKKTKTDAEAKAS